MTAKRTLRRATFLGVAILASGSLAHPQTTPPGRLQGVVHDVQGIILPGVSVALSGPAFTGARTTTTDVDGRYRFPVVPAGTYTVRFEMLGFIPSVRDEVVIVSGRASTLEVTLEPATGRPEPESDPEPVEPVVDVETTGSPATFEEQELEEVPGSSDMWTVLHASPGVRMRGYDVGGSHKSQQRLYETFGIRGQNRIINDGVNTTEGTGGAGGYYDYYAVDEFRVTAQEADVEMSTPGALVVASWKAGANEFSGLYHGDFQAGGFVADNLDEELEERGGTSARVREFYEYHFDLGGPIVRDRAWFYAAHNHYFVDRAISGQDPEVATEIGDFDTFTGKVNVQLSQKDLLIGFGHWSLKQQPFRGLSLTAPAVSTLFQESTTWFMKAEWQRVWSDRLQSDILVGHFGYEWPLELALDPEAQPPELVDPALQPPRLDTATGTQSGAGWQPFVFSRWKPQFVGRFDFFVPDFAGKHDFKFGWDWQIDRGGPAWSDAAGATRYLDRSEFVIPEEESAADPMNGGEADPMNGGEPDPGDPADEISVDRILFTNAPNQGGTDHNEHLDFFVQDNWTLNDRLTLTLGLRFGRQRLYYTDIENDPLQSDIFQPTSFEGADVIDWWNAAPRLGAAFDLTGEGRSVVRAFFGRFFVNAGSGLEAANPGGRRLETYEFLDQNENRIYDGPQELGELLEASGGGATSVDPNLELGYSDELSLSFEQELPGSIGFRFSYVHKRFRGLRTDDVNVAQALNLTQEVTVPCTGCPLGFEGSDLNLVTVPDDLEDLVDTRLMNAPVLATTGGDDTDMSFDTFQLVLNRRFRNGFYLEASVDRQFRDELRSTDASSSPFVTDPLEQQWFQNHNLDVSNRQKSTSWLGRLQARYVTGFDMGLATSVRLQSGYPWAPVHRLSVPNVGTKAIFLMDIDQNRSDDVASVDVRVDQSWAFNERFRLTVMADLYNVFNANPETNFILRTGNQFDDIIDWLPGRTLKLGMRFQF